MKRRSSQASPVASATARRAARAPQQALSVLLDQVAQFPTYTEAYLAALEQLRL
jgi:hypothetical protein